MSAARQEVSSSPGQLFKEKALLVTDLSGTVDSALAKNNPAVSQLLAERIGDSLSDLLAFKQTPEAQRVQWTYAFEKAQAEVLVAGQFSLMRLQKPFRLQVGQTIPENSASAADFLKGNNSFQECARLIVAVGEKVQSIVDRKEAISSAEYQSIAGSLPQLINKFLELKESLERSRQLNETTYRAIANILVSAQLTLSLLKVPFTIVMREPVVVAQADVTTPSVPETLRKASLHVKEVTAFNQGNEQVGLSITDTHGRTINFLFADLYNIKPRVTEQSKQMTFSCISADRSTNCVITLSHALLRGSIEPQVDRWVGRHEDRSINQISTTKKGQRITLDGIPYESQAILESFKKATVVGEYTYFTLQHPGNYPVRLKCTADQLQTLKNLIEDTIKESQGSAAEIEGAFKTIDSMIFNPVYEISINNPAEVLDGSPTEQGILALLDDRKDFFLPADYRKITTEPGLKEKIAGRYLAILLTILRGFGGRKEVLQNEDRQQIALLAAFIEVSSVPVIADIHNKLDRLQDRQKAILLAKDTLGGFISLANQEFIFIKNNITQRQLNTWYQAAKQETVTRDPKKELWDKMGSAWEAATNIEKTAKEKASRDKQQLLFDLSHRNADILRSAPPSVDHIIPMYGYYFFYVNPNDKVEYDKNDKYVKQVNNAQNNLRINLFNAGKFNVLKTPTGKLREIYKELDVVGREVKIHLMPQTKDELMVVERIFEVLRKKPELRDKIQALKIRFSGNNNPDPQDKYPEVVMYTTDQTYQDVLTAVQAEFCDLTGTGKVPRFNTEVGNHLIYLAQSGGDLKEQLAQDGVLDKIFDKNLNYAALRV